MRKLLLVVLLLAGMAGVSYAQVTLRSTTLSAQVSTKDNTDNVWSLASVSGITAGMTYFTEREYGTVVSVSSANSTVNVRRDGGIVSAHTSGVTIYVDKPEYFTLNESAGRCTASADLVATPMINLRTGSIVRCTNSHIEQEQTLTRITADPTNHLLINTVEDDRAVRINTRSYSTITSGGTSLGFQSNPAQNVTTTGTIQGGEISPRINNGFTAANIIGLHVSPYLKGTTARTVSGDVRGQQIELITDDAGTNTISGDVVGLRFRAAFSATTLTGHMVPFRVETAESQTNSQQWDALFKLTGAASDAWGSNTDSGDTEGGYISVLTDFDGNGTYTKMYLVLYSDVPTL